MKKIAVFSAVLLLFSAVLGASPAKGGDKKWEPAGWSVISTLVLGAETEYRIKNSRGTEFTLFVPQIPDARDLLRINRLAALIEGWTQLVPGKMVMRRTGEGMQLVVVPAKFVYEQVDLAAHMPGGMTFLLDDQIRYGFRMTKDRIAMKLEGVFIDRAEFMLRCLSAVKNPLAYAGKSNFVARMDRLQQELDDIKRRYVELQKNFVTLRQGVLALHNTGFLRGARAVAVKSVTRLVALKKQHPDWDADRLSAQLEKEKLELSSKEIRLILALFFNIIK